MYATIIINKGEVMSFKDGAQLGSFYLENAILNVLFSAKENNECRGVSEISKRAGIFRESGAGTENGIKSMNDAIVVGFIVKLKIENKVQKCKQPNGKGGWELTDHEFKIRKTK